MQEDNNINFLSDISDIYRKISIENEMLFDVDQEKEFLIECIENTFDKKFRLIETDVLLNDINQLNISFVNLIKFCKSNKKPYTKVHKIFIEYADYFDLPYNKCFLNLHEKLQKLIISGTTNMVGIKQYKKFDNQSNPNKIFTLFDLVK